MGKRSCVKGILLLIIFQIEKTRSEPQLYGKQPPFSYSISSASPVDNEPFRNSPTPAPLDGLQTRYGGTPASFGPSVSPSDFGNEQRYRSGFNNEPSFTQGFSPSPYEDVQSLRPSTFSDGQSGVTPSSFEDGGSLRPGFNPSTYNDEQSFRGGITPSSFEFAPNRDGQSFRPDLQSPPQDNEQLFNNEQNGPGVHSSFSFGDSPSRSGDGRSLGYYGSTQSPPLNAEDRAYHYSPRPDGNFRFNEDRVGLNPNRNTNYRKKPYKSQSGLRHRRPFNIEISNNVGKSPNSGYGPNYFNELNSFGFGQQGQGNCPVVKPCRPSKYRSFDGSCNNLRNPLWGASGTPYGRLVPPKYADGIHAPPRSVTGSPLPEPRHLSRIFFPSSRKDDPIWTLATMQWGQIVTHDMSLAMDTLPNPAAPECCTPEGPLLKKISKGEPCFPITLSRDDSMFQKYGQTCMDFLRTTTDMQNGCPSSRHAKPLSAVSHWLDGSTVYGPDDSTAQDLRAFEGGMLRVDIKHNRPFPPSSDNATLGCLPSAPACYFTGDVRVNQNPQLALIQILLMREHNKVARILSIINKHWDDERLFQEARKIVIGEIQHITYYEYLPVILGERTTLDAGITYLNKGSYINDYNERINPNVLNEHAHSAFRFLHTNIQGMLLLMSERRLSQGHLRLPEHMNDASILEMGAFDDLARGLCTQAQHDTDRFHAQEVVENLFRRPENPRFGFDLKAVDIHRGRDHGLSSYNDYRARCNYPRAKSFSDFSDLIDTEDIQRLKNIYAHPDDVDLSVGAALEHGANNGGLMGLGPTFSCIIKEQFVRTRIGDRFFYEHGDHPSSFTSGQLREIRKSSFARLVCDNSDDVSTIQPKAFLKLSKSNSLAPCEEFDTIPAPNFEAWREVKSSRFSGQRFRPDFE